MSNRQLAKASISNLLFTFGSQGTSLILSIILTLFVPKELGIVEFGYWQLYLFYTGYVGFFHFGLNDGINLRNAGTNYNELKKPIIRSQLYILLISQFIIAGAIVILAYIFMDNSLRFNIMIFTTVCLILTNLEIFFWYILQASSRIKEYSISVVLEKILFLILVFFFIFQNIRSFELYIIANLISKFIGLLISMAYCKDLLFGEISKLKLAFSELRENISSGSKLMFSNIASMLIIGNGRFVIDKVWGISTFSKVSFSFTLSSMILLFINAVSLVLFPTLKKIPQERLSEIYNVMRTILMVLLTGGLILYIPLNYLIAQWLPEYSESLRYMAIIFPICIFEGKMQMLVVTNLKVMRKEGILLKSNILSLLLSILFCIISAYVIKSMVSVVVSIAIVIILRCFLAEYFLSLELKLPCFKNYLNELLLTLSFTVSAWYIEGYLSMIVYLTAYMLFIYVNRKSIFTAILTVKKVFV